MSRTEDDDLLDELGAFAREEAMEMDAREDDPLYGELSPGEVATLTARVLERVQPVRTVPETNVIAFPRRTAVVVGTTVLAAAAALMLVFSRGHDTLPRYRLEPPRSLADQRGETELRGGRTRHVLDQPVVLLLRPDAPTGAAPSVSVTAMRARGTTDLPVDVERSAEGSLRVTVDPRELEPGVTMLRIEIDGPGDPQVLTHAFEMVAP